MKKILMLAVAATTFASAANAQDKFSGFNVSARAGGNTVMGKGDATKSGTAFAGDVVIGFGSVMDSFYLGAEGSAGYAGKSNLGKVGTTSVSREAGLIAGVAAKIGVVCSPDAMIYITPGVAIDQNKMQSVTAAGVKTETKKNNVVFKVGLGAQYALNEQLSLRADVDYSAPQKYTIGTINGKISKVGFKVGVTFRF